MVHITELLTRLWPITRSITGNGVRQTLTILNELVPIKTKEYPTGLNCFDWSIPKEWNIQDAYVKNKQGKRIIDFKKNNLHVMSYSIPVRQIMSRDELLKHIHTLPDQPNAIPYLTSYYQERWGFCLEHERLAELADDEYEVMIDSTLEEGHLTIGEGFIPGQREQEVLFSTYVCHPSMGNNELSGPVVQSYLYDYLLRRSEPLKYSYRFLYVPETIGAIVYLSQYGQALKEKLVAGYVVTCIGDPGAFTYKKSRRGNTLADRVAEHVLSYSEKPYQIVDWYPGGSDERQYCSPGFNLPVGSLMRSMYGKYPEYHTSLDNLAFITPAALTESIDIYIQIIETLELNDTYTNLNPYCEPQLGKRSLYPTLGAQKNKSQLVKQFRYLLAFSDGDSDIIDIAERLKVPCLELKEAIQVLTKESLLDRS